METFCYMYLILLSGFSDVVTAVRWKNRKIDWEVDAHGMYNLFESDFRAGEMNKLGKDIFVEGFVQLTPHSTIEGDFIELSKYYAHRSGHGNWVEGTRHIYPTCDNMAVVWAKLFFTDFKNVTQKGFVSSLFEHVGDRAMVRLVQSTV